MSSDAPVRKRHPFRWLTLAEIVGVLALGVAGLTYWDSHRQHLDEERRRAEDAREHAQDRAEAARERQAEQQASVQKTAFLMTAAPDGEGRSLRLQSLHPDQAIQTQTLWFPVLVRPDSVQTTGNPRIEAGWIEAGLRKAAGKVRQGRIPVTIETTYVEDGESRTDRSLYRIGYSLRGRMLGGAKLSFEGLSLARRNVSGDPQAAADGLWIGR